VLVTGCGYPDIATRALVSKLSSKCAVRACGLQYVACYSIQLSSVISPPVERSSGGAVRLQPLWPCSAAHIQARIHLFELREPRDSS